MGPNFEVEIHMDGFAVHCVARRAVGSPVNMSRKGRWPPPFGPHGELNALMDDVVMCNKMLKVKREKKLHGLG
jgi:hypothetical protein